jgi:predicted nucleic acid-binding protein
VVVTSRLSLVESARALHRLRQRAAGTEEALADLEREIDGIWSRCHVWELSRSVCDLAQLVAPATALRTLDAIHLATYLHARRRLPGLELLTTDDRLARAAAGA